MQAVYQLVVTMGDNRSRLDPSHSDPFQGGVFRSVETILITADCIGMTNFVRIDDTNCVWREVSWLLVLGELIGAWHRDGPGQKWQLA